MVCKKCTNIYQAVNCELYISIYIYLYLYGYLIDCEAVSYDCIVLYCFLNHFLINAINLSK